MKSSLVMAAIAVIGCGAAVIYIVEKPSSDVQPTSAVPPAVTDAIPTPEYLFEHPDALKEAEQKCSSGDIASSLFCSNVHKAESLRLADQYRRGTQPNGTGR
ncbi:MAG: hypothetical protein V4527_05410 [Pseudomonadota bacterium]